MALKQNTPGTLNTTGVSENLMNIREVATWLNMKQSTLYAYVERKQIPHIRIGKLVRFSRQQIDTWLAALSVVADETDTCKGKNDYKGFHKSPNEIDEIVQRALAVSGKGIYTAKRGKQTASAKEA